MNRRGLVLALIGAWLGLGGCSNGQGGAGGPPDNGLTVDACAAAAASCGSGGGACGGSASVGFEGQEINLVPSNFTPPDATSKPSASKPAKTWKSAGAKPNASRLQVGDKDFLPLEGAEVTAEVVGFRARVVLDLLYRNDREQQLNGAFQLRLPDGATPYYLAFGATKWEKPQLVPTASTAIADIRMERATSWESPKEARVVPRAKAAHAYGETVRKKVDPALLEWAGAGVFRAQVYPLEPGALHRITIGYEVSLIPVGDEMVLPLDLPEIENGELEVDITARGINARVEPGAEQQEGRWHWHNPDTRRIVLRGATGGALTLAGEDAATGPYFATQFAPRIPTAPGQPESRAVFLLDTSLSSNPDAFRVWVRLLKEVLERNRAQVREFAVAAFNIETHWWRPGFTANTEANVAAVMRWADTLALEGATDVARALRAAGSRDGAFDLFLLSDGSPTWGESDIVAIAEAAPDGHRLYAYVTGLGGTDQRVLRNLARETQGSVFTVTGPSQIVAAATAHTKRPWRLDEVTLAGCSDILVAGRPTTIYPGQRLTIAGRGIPKGPAVVHISREGDTRTDEIAIGDVTQSEMAPTLYGRLAVGRLEELGSWTEEEARAYATHFRVVGATCSLLMLETEADYEAYDIKPKDDASVVQREGVTTIAQKAEEAAAGTRASPRQRFLKLLKALEGAPGVAHTPSLTLHEVLRRVPETTFRVPEGQLALKARTWATIPGSIQEHLAARDLDYAETSREAVRRKQKYGAADALRAWSSLVEQNPGDMALARDVGYVAMELGLRAQAHHLFWRVAERRPYQPHAWMAMARCLADMGNPELAMLFYEAVVSTKWPDQYGETELIAAFEYLRFLRGVERMEQPTAVSDLVPARRDELAARLKVKTADLVILIAWNTDRTDVDLHVTDPTGEECFYSHKTTKMGGRITQDVTQGFGPEMFVLSNAAPGRYRVEANYFSADAARTATRTKVHATVIENWGRDNERVSQRVVLLEQAKQRHNLVDIRWDGTSMTLPGAD